jgi:hypothetical protein
MKVPNAEQALIDPLKLSDYCLNPEHPRGKHKAQVFESALGLTLEDADVLYDALLAAVQEQEAELGEKDEFGQRYTVDFKMMTAIGEAFVRSTWIIRATEDFPRLTTCYVL